MPSCYADHNDGQPAHSLPHGATPAILPNLIKEPRKQRPLAPDCDDQGTNQK